MYKRVLIKLSGEALAGGNRIVGDSTKPEIKLFDRAVVTAVAAQLKRVVNSGIEICVMVGGGNIWRGAKSDKNVTRSVSDNMGMLATLMSALYLADCIREDSTGPGEPVGSRILAPFSVGALAELYCRENALRYMADREVVIFGGGSGLTHFSTDTPAMIRAIEIDADVILLAKNGVAGIHEHDPAKVKDSQVIKHLKFKDIIADSIGEKRFDSVMDIAASCTLYNYTKPAIVFGIDNPENIYRVATGEQIGTLITN